jgi:hypothetical protein
MKTMETRLNRRTAVAACATLFATAATVEGAEPNVGEKIAEARPVRASKLMGMHVKNQAGEKIGSIEDVVIDVGSGRVAYVALGVGGVFGVGEKLFASPLSALKFEHHDKDMAFVLNTTKEKLEASPGFHKDHWPDLADPKWTDQIDKYYGAPHKSASLK